MKSNNLFKLSQEHKKFVLEVASLCGVKQETVLFVLEYIFYANFLNMLDSGSSTNSICIPYLGEISIKNGETFELKITQSFRDIIKDLHNNNIDDIKSYFEKNWINNLLDEIEETS